MTIITALEAAAVLLFLAGLLNESRLIEWERRTARKIQQFIRRHTK